MLLLFPSDLFDITFMCGIFAQQDHVGVFNHAVLRFYVQSVFLPLVAQGISLGGWAKYVVFFFCARVSVPQVCELRNSAPFAVAPFAFRLGEAGLVCQFVQK